MFLVAWARVSLTPPMVRPEPSARITPKTMSSLLHSGARGLLRFFFPFGRRAPERADPEGGPAPSTASSTTAPEEYSTMSS